MKDKMKSYPEEYYANPILTLIPGNLGIHRQQIPCHFHYNFEDPVDISTNIWRVSRGTNVNRVFKVTYLW